MRKKLILCAVFIISALSISGCNNEPTVINTFEETPIELIDECFEKSEDYICKTYYEMSDGTWKTDDHTYRYRLIISGRMNNAAKDSTYTILSNTEDISFDRAWKASGLSSDINDYFKAEDAVFVAIK